MSESGLYVHIPFCLTRCGYCDFNAYEGLGHLASSYADALTVEAALTQDEWQGMTFSSVFLGGGTPTTLPASALDGLLRRLRAAFDIRADAEITCEANPDTVDRGYFEDLRVAGVTRVSIGVQSFDPSALAALERLHAPESAIAAFDAARAARFEDVNLDLIYGAHGESLDSWRCTLQQALALGPDHLSCYALTVEPNTPLGRKVHSGLIPAPDPDLQAEMYDLACSLLESAGYEHYEISNWALPGHRSRHNAGYWEGRAYLGLGAGAHSHREGRRWWNVRPPAQYIELVRSGKAPIGGEELLTQDERHIERLLLGLRVVEGVPTDWVDEERADAFVGEGLARREGHRIALTDRGMLLANEVVLALAGM